MTIKELRDKARDAGIKGWHLMKEDTLRERVEALKIIDDKEYLSTEVEPVSFEDAVPLIKPNLNEGARVLVERDMSGGKERLWIYTKDANKYVMQGWRRA
jgi:hypothetical protein